MNIFKGKIKTVKKIKTGYIIRVFCPELNEFDLIQFNQNIMKFGYFGFSIDEWKDQVEKVMGDLSIGVDEKGKSQSQRLRGKLLEYYDKVYTGDLLFKDFYQKTIQKLYDKVNSKIVDEFFSHYDR